MRSIYRKMLTASAAAWALGCAAPSSSALPANTEGAGEAPGELAGTISNVEQEVAAIEQALAADPYDAAALARAAELNRRADESMGLLHSVDMGEGRAVKFYQLADGSTAIGQSGPASAEPVLPEGFTYNSFAELHEYLKPGTAVPDVLMAADARIADPMLAQQPELAVVPQGALPEGVDDAPYEGLIEKHGTSSCSHFQDEHRCRSGDASFCMCNRTGGGTFTLSPAHSSFQMISSYKGTISVDILRNSVSYGPYVVPQGQFNWWTMSAAECETCSLPNTNWGACTVRPCDETHGQRIYNATGDEYHRHLCINNLGGGNCN